MTRPLLIWGAGGHGREVNHVCEVAGIAVAGFLDERPPMRGAVVDDVPVLGGLDDLPANLVRTASVFVGGVGDPRLKRRFLADVRARGLRLAPSVVHPAVNVYRRNTVSEGVFLAEGCTLTVDVVVGEHATVNRAVTLSHGVRIGPFATIAPAVALAGDVTVGEGAFVGIAAAAREKTTIGAWAVVGGGAFVAADVPPGTLVMGVPARAVRSVEA